MSGSVNWFGKSVEVGDFGFDGCDFQRPASNATKSTVFVNSLVASASMTKMILKLSATNDGHLIGLHQTIVGRNAAVNPALSVNKAAAHQCNTHKHLYAPKNLYTP